LYRRSLIRVDIDPLTVLPLRFPETFAKRLEQSALEAVGIPDDGDFACRLAAGDRGDSSLNSDFLIENKCEDEFNAGTGLVGASVRISLTSRMSSINILIHNL